MARKTLTKEQKELAEKLVRTGMKRSTATALVYVASKNETNSIEIEKVTHLRQPEVSIAMEYLKEQGWVTQHIIKKEGKGRPIQGFKMDIPFDEIIKGIETKENERSEEIKGNMKAIKTLAKSI